MGLYNRPTKRARVVPDRFSLERFGCGGYPTQYSGPFRANIRGFLCDFAQQSPVLPQIPGVHQQWCIPFLIENKEKTISMFVFEELPNEPGTTLHCDHCRMIGWFNHPVCKTRYHFIIPVAEDINQVACAGCGSLVAPSTSCPSCGICAPKSVLDVQTHLLHGILHANGYGHLLRVNGHEGGSRYLSGTDIMDLWDRTCTMLRTRKVGVLDVSKKFGLEYRLVHAIAKGQPWYGTWGYTSARGSFGISDKVYRDAVKNMAELRLRDIGEYDKELSTIINRYQHWSKGLLTLRDLVKYLIELARAMHRQRLAAASEPVPISETIGNSNSGRWPAHRLEKTFNVLISALKSFGVNRWVTREKLREQAFQIVRDRGLLDHSLCSFVGKNVDNDKVVERRTDKTKHYEYRLAQLDDKKVEAAFVARMQKEEKEFTGVKDHLMYIHDNLLMGKNPALAPFVEAASRIIFETKHFVKDYKGNLLLEDEDQWEEQRGMRIQCKLEVIDEANLDKREACGAPSELVILNKTGTLSDLKKEACKAFRDVYFCFGKIQVVSIPVFDSSGQEGLSLQGTTYLVMKVTGADNSSPTRFEKGLDDWRVHCRCGARDDDGERMVACDTCGIWSHTRCNLIPDTDPVPEHFLCGACKMETSSMSSNSNSS